MARVAVLIDRPPGCPEWKGWAAWALINALAESQHELQVFTPLDPGQIGVTHARVGVARPASSFAVKTLPNWLRALVSFRPDVIHTFAPRATGQWPKLTCWPYLEGVSSLLPGARRIATVFDEGDLQTPASSWLRSHRRWTSFDPAVAVTTDFAGRIDATSGAGLLPNVAAAPIDFDDGEILVPAPVDEWRDRALALAALGGFLLEDPSRRVRIVGGWGQLPLAERRETWIALKDFTARVHLGPPLSLPDFVRDVAHARGLWREPLKAGSWRARVSALVENETDPLEDAVNHLSRIYSATGGW